MRRAHKYILAFFLIVSTTASFAYACSCARNESDEKHIQGTDVIFYGQAIQTIDTPLFERPSRSLGREQSTQFNVIEIWKGKAEFQKTVFHPNGNNCCYCGLIFDTHEYYLVFAHINDKGELTSSYCAGTIAVSLSKYRIISKEEPNSDYSILKALTKNPSTKY